MRTYKFLGEIITKNEGVGGYALPFQAYVNGTFLYADCYSEMKRLIVKEHAKVGE